MRERVQQYMQREVNLNTILVAVSGGADSMALLHIMCNINAQKKFTLVALHAHHGLREEADADAALVRTVCADWGIPYVQKQLSVRAYCEQHRIGVQQGARTLRYQFFQEAMMQLDGDVLMTAHHGDDEVETVLMKMVRGTTPLTNIGIAPDQPYVNGRLIRPLLQETKQQILAYCHAHEVPFHEDESNASSMYTRNRFRAQIVPVLKKENPHIHVHTHRFSRWHVDDNDYLFAEAEKVLVQMTKVKKSGYVKISKPLFRRIAPALQRRMIHLILSYLYSGEAVVSALHIEQVQSFLMRKSSSEKRLHLRGGLRVILSYDTCTFTCEQDTNGDLYKYPLSIPGQCETPLGVIQASVAEEVLLTCEQPYRVMFPMRALKKPLYIRNRKEGDVFSPLGMTGTKKISRLFIDCKIAPLLRQKWPLVVDADDEILWIPGLHRSLSVKKGESTESIVTLSFYKYDCDG
ncbi:tRNA lysidine(34) synthetase TilS [Shouchella lonarensis]|uniref:tRNA(Ile)-lysidine synthase n=1 Tax=Shouchella lonarensis TaxID=1464122 RepID=A0A1G6NTB9_9BACI|nr:tRNA lysidine(34) synthetase TilS [Shouchella lonarensis]SDC71008.1 tRNA(Ile)-lysidine synthase [Shouchella lonarensis]